MAKIGVASAGSPAAGTAIDADMLIRSVLFIATFLAVWASFHPFPSLSEPPVEVTEGGDRVNQICFSILFLVFAAWAYFHQPSRLLPLLRPSFVATLIWCAACVVTSWEPLLSARRLIFTIVLLSVSAIVVLLPKNIRHFSDLFAATVLFVLALCYLGVLFAPDFSIHQATDFLEPEHAGKWRGIFTHKNYAGVTMVLFIFIGMFVARVRSIAVGGLIIVSSAVFLFFTQSKTAIGVLPIALILTACINRLNRPVAGVLLVLSVLVGFGLITVGSVYFESIRDLLETILPDATFTGRTDLWQFGLQYLMQRPIMGYGFSAFWGTEQVVYGLGDNSSWVNAASDAHNAYLNLALTIGIPGLALVIVWIIVMPIVDFCHRAPSPHTRALQLLFLRLLLFCVFSSCFENSIFQQLDSVWFPFSMAAFGLRYMAIKSVELQH